MFADKFNFRLYFWHAFVFRKVDSTPDKNMKFLVDIIFLNIQKSVFELAVCVSSCFASLSFYVYKRLKRCEALRRLCVKFCVSWCVVRRKK